MNAAVVVTKPRHAEVRPREPDELEPDEVRLRVDGCGVCGSDLAVWQGRDWFRYPLDPGAPGHEAWGTIDEVGSRVTHITPGQRVVGLFHGAYAETAVAPAEHVVPIPHEAADQPLPGEAVACAVNAAGRADMHAGDHVAVIGIGFQGALIVQLARAAGADVTAISRRGFACDLGERLGAHRAVQAHTPEQAPEVRAAIQGDPFDVVFEVTGQQASLDLAGDLVKTRGRLMIAGFHQDTRQVNMQDWNWKGLDVINAHEREPARYIDGMRKGLKQIADGRLDIRPLITHQYRLDEAHEAFEAMERRDEGFLKGVIRP